MAYTLTGKKSGTIKFTNKTGTITKESSTASSKMTSNAIENGSSIEDHVSLNPQQSQISGITIGNQDAIRERLESMWRNRELITYTGRTRLKDYVIINLQISNEAKNLKGFAFSATLQKATIVSGQYVEIGKALLMSQDKPKTKTAQTSAVKAQGLKTTLSTSISQSAYNTYVNSYNTKSNPAPLVRNGASFAGARLEA